MGSFVVKAAKDRDLYLIWSTVVDAPTLVGNRQELGQYLWAEYRREHPDSTPGAISSPDARITRADGTGTSALDCDWFGWGDETFTVVAGSPGDGWYHLRRDRLADYAEALLRDDEEAAVALLECWKRHGEGEDGSG